MRLAVALFFLAASVSAEEVIEEVTTQVLTPTVSGNLLPGLAAFTTSGDATLTGNGSGCQPGEACTGAQGGIYSTTVDLTETMTIEEINAGFDLEYGVTVDSHSSNASLPTCDQTNGDCQDNFNLTLTLHDGETVVQEYEHEFVLDYGGLRDYQFEQTVVENSWSELTALIELYGQDAGYPSGLYGPQFTDPWLTTGYNAISYITEQIVTIVQDDMDDVVEEILDDDMEQPELEIVLEEPEPDETFVVDAEEIFSNPVLSEIVGTGDTVTVTLTEAGTGNIVDSFQVDVQSETVTSLPVVDTSTEDTSTSSLESVDTLQSIDTVESMDSMDSMGFEEMPESTVAEVFEEMPEMEAAVAEVDAIDSEPAAMEVAEAEPEPVETEMTEPDSEVAEVETAEAEEGSEIAEAEGSSEPESAGTEQERTEEPARVASGPDKKTEPEKKVSAKEKAKAKKQRLVKKISTRVMATLSQNYESAMQGAALSVMQMSAATYAPTQLEDLQSWYAPAQLDGGTNYDHPASMWFSAQANQNMTRLVEMQWPK